MNRDSEVIVCVDDVKAVFVRSYPRLKRLMICASLFALAYGITRPPSYLATATFKQSFEKHLPMEGIQEMFKQLSFSTEEAGAIPVMRSLQLMRSVIEKLGLQASVADRGVLLRLGLRVWDNLVSEAGGTPSARQRFVFRDVRYEEEKAQSFYVHVLSKERFELLDSHKNVMGTALFGEPLHAGAIALTLCEVPDKVSFEKHYPLKMLPWQKLCKKELSRLNIKVDKLEKHFLRLSYSSADRCLAAAFLNELMESYRAFLKKENEETAEEQLAYLEKREAELCFRFETTLDEQAHYLAATLGEEGFIGLKQEVELLSGPREEYTTKLFNIDLELKRMEPLAAPWQSAPSQSCKGPQKELEKISCEAEETARFLEVFKAKREVPSSFSVLEKTAPALSLLVKKFQEQKEGADLALFEKHLEERLVSLKLKQKSCAENLCLRAEDGNFQWITLETARRLYTAYNDQIDATQATIKKLLFFRDEMKEASFELSSLSTVLSDAVTNRIVEKASALALQLRDERSSSLKEQERIKDALLSQKETLLHHMDQSIELEKLKLHTAREHVAALRTTSLELMKQEKELLEEKLRELKGRMSRLPDKWRLENQLKFKVDLSKTVVETMAQLMEAKTLSRHLYHVDSKAIDEALAPAKPSYPALLIFSMSIALLIGTAAFLFYLFKAMAQGLPITLGALKARGRKDGFELSSFADAPFREVVGKNLETLRSLSSFLFSEKGAVAALFCHKKADYSHNLAQLLAKQGLKVLLIHNLFPETVSQEERPGLWHVLCGEIDLCPVRSKEGFDFLPMGGASSHMLEKLKEGKFSALLAEYKSLYDVVLLACFSEPTSQEALFLLGHVDRAALSPCEKSFEALEPYFTWEEKKAKPTLCFIL